MKKTTKIISVILCVLLAASMVTISASAKKSKKFVKSIKVSKKATLTIPAGKKSISKAFKVTVKVRGKASKKFTAKSSNASVASVKAKGSKITVTAKKAGTAKIKVTTKAKNKKKKKLSKTLTVTVKKSTAAAPKTPGAPTNPTPPAVDPTQPNTPPAVEPTQPQTAPATEPAPITTEPATEAPAPREITLNTTLQEISRKGSSGKNDQGEETVVDIPLWQSTSVFNNVPANVEELKQVHRADALLPNEVDAAITAEDGAKGRFEVVALYFAALKAYDPDNPEVCYAMMEEICESPHTEVLNIDSFNNFSRSSLNSNMKQNNKYKYLGDAYFDGATPANKYTPNDPPTVVLEDYVYSSQTSNQYQTQIYKITCRFPGADNERIIQVYQSANGKWYIFSDSWMGFTSDIKAPSLF